MTASRRIKKLRAGMKKKNIDTAVFISSEPLYDPNVYYLTGFRQERYHSFSCLIVNRKKTALVLSSLDYDRASGKEADEIIEKGCPLSKIIRERASGSIGIVSGLFPFRLSVKLRKLKDITSLMDEIRSVKDSGEIETIRKACRITNFGIKFIENSLKGMTERELAGALEDEMKGRGAEGMSFPTIVTSSGSSAIHPFPSFSGRKIGRGLGLVDFGIIYRGYCTDVTVPFSVGRLKEREKKIVETVEGAYERTLDKLKAGVETRTLFETAEWVIKEAGFELRHGLGHGIGLEVHESPQISSRKGGRIRKNSVFTIEPGVYVPGTGGCRLENDFLAKAGGFEVLTKSRFFKI